MKKARFTDADRRSTFKAVRDQREQAEVKPAEASDAPSETAAKSAERAQRIVVDARK